MVEFERKVRVRNLYDPHSDKPYKLSRSRLDNFIRCAHCFYLDRRLGVNQPSIPGYTLNSAVDALLKKEFDGYRKLGETHPLMKEHGIDAIPFAHPSLDDWRANFKGITFHHSETNFTITGAVDDIWITPNQELIVVDYKATSVKADITAETHLRTGYRRQLEIYQWLFKKNGFQVSSTGYLVYANGLKNREQFDQKLEFSMTILPYRGDSSWVERRIYQAHQCLNNETPPPVSAWCGHCAYRNNAALVLAGTIERQ
ncbi:PD-(D/E)XK nuclease family protein [Gemmatimonas aurantiaca]|nr:PD-(D/E)XK nuclease family protein [Gemmatimonas aurantiaca]